MHNKHNEFYGYGSIQRNNSCKCNYNNKHMDFDNADDDHQHCGGN